MPEERIPPPGAIQDLSGKKSDFIGSLVELAGDIMAVAKRCDEAAAFYFANTFNTGGANVITQNDISGANAHLTVTDVTNMITAAQAITTATPQGTRDNIRKALKGKTF